MLLVSVILTVCDLISPYIEDTIRIRHVLKLCTELQRHLCNILSGMICARDHAVADA